MGLLYLVEQHDGVGVAAYALRQLSALLVAHISRRRAYKSRHVETLGILAHVNAYQGIGGAEHELGQLLRQISLAHTRRPEKHERADGAVGVFQSHAVALYGLHHLVDGRILRYHRLLQLAGHALQAYALGLRHALHGHSRHHRHHVGHVGLRHGLPLVVLAAGPLLVQFPQFGLQLCLSVAVAGSQFEVLVSYGALLFLLYIFYLLLLFGYLRRNTHAAQVHARAHLVECVDGLVGKLAVGDVPACQFDTRRHGLVSVCHMVVVLVAVFYVAQYGERFVGGGRFDDDLLEPPLQRPVLLYAVAVFVERGGTYALYRAPCQCRLEYVGGVHAAGCRAGPYERVYLVDEDDDVGVLLYLLYQRPYTLFKLSAVFRARHHRCHEIPRTV